VQSTSLFASAETNHTDYTISVQMVVQVRFPEGQRRQSSC